MTHLFFIAGEVPAKSDDKPVECETDNGMCRARGLHDPSESDLPVMIPGPFLSRVTGT